MAGTSRRKLSKKQQRKFDKVMNEFGGGTLTSSSGALVDDREQALAIAFSEARKV